MDPDLAEFCRAEHRRLVGLLSLYCRDRHLAEELAQDALVRVVSHWPTVRSLDAPSAWAYRVAINLANSHLRRRLAERRASRRLQARAVPAAVDPDTPTARCSPTAPRTRVTRALIAVGYGQRTAFRHLRRT